MNIAKLASGNFLQLELPDFQKHIYAIGRTGTGKSTLLFNIALDHIMQGHGLTVIDPHGDLVQALADTIPPERTNHVIYLDMADSHSVGFDPLINPHFTRTAFKDIWDDSWGARLDWYLYNGLALIKEKNLTLQYLPRLLYDPRLRKTLTQDIRDEALREFWTQEFPLAGQKYVDDAKGPILNKVGQFLTLPKLRATLLQRSPKLNFARAMFEKRIILVNLAKHIIGAQPASLVGALIVSAIKAAAMAGPRTPHFLVVDEFHTVGTSAFVEILSEARKFNLSLTLAHQFTSQLREEVLAAILGNVGTLVCFRVGITDAELLAPEFHPLQPQALADQFPFNAWLKRNSTLSVEPLLTLPMQPAFTGRAKTVIKESRQSFARSL